MPENQNKPSSPPGAAPEPHDPASKKAKGAGGEQHYQVAVDSLDGHARGKILKESELAQGADVKRLLKIGALVPAEAPEEE